MGCLPWYLARDLQWYLVLCTADTLVLKFKRIYLALSGVRHIRANPPGLGVRSYTGHVNWWLKLLITHWKLWGSILLIVRSEVDLDTPCSKRTGISKETLDSLCYHKQKQAAETSLWYHLASHLTPIDQHVWGPCNQIQILFLWLQPWLRIIPWQQYRGITSFVIALDNIRDTCSSFPSDRMQGLVQ